MQNNNASETVVEPISNIGFVLFYLLSIQLIPLILCIIKAMCWLFGIESKTINWQKYTEWWVYDLAAVDAVCTCDSECSGIIERGYVLPNHRSFFDFAYDPMMCRGTVVGRGLAYLAVFFYAVLHYLSDNTPIVIFRDWNTRQQVFQKMVNYLQTASENVSRVVVYIEGTRRRHLTIDSPENARSYMKMGVLRSIYDDSNNYPCQVVISSNKELVFDEKSLSLNRHIRVRTHVSRPIFARDYQTFDEFVDAISVQWHKCWQVAYRTGDKANYAN